MFKLIKVLFYAALIGAFCTAAWFAFAIWIDLYTVYSFPPSKEYPKGVTYILHREEWEPKFNSPDYKAPKREETGKGEMGYSSSANRPKRPIPLRTIVKLPYIEWAYKQSLETPKAQAR